MFSSKKKKGSPRSSGPSKRRDDNDLVKGMSSLSVSNSSAPRSSREAPNFSDTRRSNDDRYTKSSSGRSDYQDSYSGPRAGDDHSSRGDHPSREPHSSSSDKRYRSSDTGYKSSDRGYTSSDRGYTSSDRGYPTSANPDYREVARGSTTTASGAGPARATRSQTKEGTKKVSSDRVEKSSTRKGRGAKVKKAKSKSPSPPKGANHGQLSVEIYAPRANEGNVPHWSLFVENANDGRGIIRDVIGEPLGFRFRAADNILPESSGQHTRSIPVAEIDDVDYFDQTVRATAIQNDVQGWSCQDWILEALEDLNVNEILGDYEYNEAKERLGRRYNRGASSSPSE
jgi:hypothetical protein